MPAQHEHELESQHPMTPGSFETRVCRYERDACQRPEGTRLVDCRNGHLRPPPWSVSSPISVGVLRLLTRIGNIVNNIRFIQIQWLLKLTHSAIFPPTSRFLGRDLRCFDQVKLSEMATNSMVGWLLVVICRYYNSSNEEGRHECCKQETAGADKL